MTTSPECSAQRQTICGTASKNFNTSTIPAEWANATATSGYFCKTGATLTPASPLPVFPRAGQTVRWRCNNASRVGTECSAKNEFVVQNVCGTAAKTFTNQYTTPTEWSSATATSGYFCKVGASVTPASPLPVFPRPNQSVSWKCDGIAGTSDCRADNKSKLPVFSSTLQNSIKTRAELGVLASNPNDTTMCGPDGAVKREGNSYKIWLDDIYWRWECTLKNPPAGADPNMISTQCYSKNCLANIRQDLQVYFKTNGTVDPAKLAISQNCDICCTYTNRSNTAIKVHVCSGTPGEIKVDGHPDEIERVCRDDCRRYDCPNGSNCASWCKTQTDDCRRYDCPNGSNCPSWCKTKVVIRL